MLKSGGKCKECINFKSVKTGSKGWCSSKINSCNPEGPLCSPTLLEKELNVVKKDKKNDKA